MPYCTMENLLDYVLEQYLEKIEDLNEGSVDRHILQVSGEIDEAIQQGGYSIPDGATSNTLTRICAVMAAWRSIGEITSLMDTEASSNNEWLPLQKLNSRAEKDLDMIRAGKLDPFPGSTGEAGDILVSAPEVIFSSEKWEKF